MADALNLTLWMCDGSLPGASVSSAPHDGPSSIDETEDSTSLSAAIPMMPLDVAPEGAPPVEVTLQLVPAGITEPALCRADGDGIAGDSYIGWDFAMVTGDTICDRIKIELMHPSLCNWIRNTLSGLLYGIHAFWEPIGGGEFPPTKDLAFPLAGMTVSHETDQVVPGEPLVCAWTLQDPKDKSVFEHAVEVDYFSTGSFTGGVVKSGNVTEAPEDPPTYQVAVEGQLLTLTPSDYYPYQLGDWVLIINKGAGGDTPAGPVKGGDIEDIDPADLVMVPFTFQDEGPGT